MKMLAKKKKKPKPIAIIFVRDQLERLHTLSWAEAGGRNSRYHLSLVPDEAASNG